MKANKCLLAISVITGMILFYSSCIDVPAGEMADVRGSAYAGSGSCMPCHKEVAGSYLHNAHFNTSWSEKEVAKRIPVATGRYVFDEHTSVAIEKRDSGLYQVSCIDGKDSVAKRFEMGFGSGAHAFSFGYWQNKTLYQLPLSWFHELRGWRNSPGFPAHRANFQRPVIRRCFECHSSFVAEDPEQSQGLTQVRQLEKTSVIYGIDCERCHGAAAEHVSFHTENPSVKDARYIAGWAPLSRQQKIDACAVCHSGNDLETRRSTFSFKPGDTLSTFYYPEFAAMATGTPDVHGKQAQLLAASRCFRETKTMECTSCHNLHGPKNPGLADYSTQCLSCHKNILHKSFPVKQTTGNGLVSNCIDCHMPKEASALISFQAMGKEKADAYLLTTHRIAIYPEATKKIVNQIKTGNNP